MAARELPEGRSHLRPKRVPRASGAVPPEAPHFFSVARNESHDPGGIMPVRKNPPSRAHALVRSGPPGPALHLGQK